MYVCMYGWINANDGIIFRTDKHFCWMDGNVAFRKGELVSGRLGETIVYIHTYIHILFRVLVNFFVCKLICMYICMFVCV